MDTPERLSDRFRQVFERVQRERMSGLGLMNPALRVAVVGWRDWEQRRVGVLLTPWTMSLVCVPGPGGGPGIEHSLRFPSGEYVFVEARETEIGGFALCSLFSPVFEFTDQAAALATASAALEALFDPRLAGEQAQAPAESPPAERVLSRRELLRGAFLGPRP